MRLSFVMSAGKTRYMSKLAGNWNRYWGIEK
jgi:hypothetical protein